MTTKHIHKSLCYYLWSCKIALWWGDNQGEMDISPELEKWLISLLHRYWSRLQPGEIKNLEQPRSTDIRLQIRHCRSIQHVPYNNNDNTRMWETVHNTSFKYEPSRERISGCAVVKTADIHQKIPACMLVCKYQQKKYHTGKNSLRPKCCMLPLTPNSCPYTVALISHMDFFIKSYEFDADDHFIASKSCSDVWSLFSSRQDRRHHNINNSCIHQH